MVEGVSETVAAVVSAAGGIFAGGIDVGYLIVAVGVVLTSRHERRTVSCQVGAHIYHGAGRGTDHAQQQGSCQGCHKEPKFFHCFHFCSPSCDAPLGHEGTHGFV